ncbi:MAG: hypothetical protein ABFE13_26640 [Phycisphaerales bacterium]
MKVKSVILLVTAVVVCMTMSASADPFTVAYSTVAPGQDYNFSLNYGGSYSGTRAGIYNLTISQTDLGDMVTDGEYDSFCIDVWDTAGTSTDYRDVVLEDAPDYFSDGMGSVKASKIAYLLDSYWNDLYLTGPDANKNAAALQLVVWEIVSESTATYGLTSGSFRAYASNNAARDQADIWLSSLGSGNVGNYIAVTSTSKQDYVVKVPVPGAVLLGLLGLGYAGMKLRRRCD